MPSSPPQFTIRSATRDDVPAIVEFNRRLARETEARELDPDVLSRGVEAVIADPSLGFYLVALQADVLIGQLMVTSEWSDWRNGLIWWFQSVYVHGDYRRKGVFRRLFLRVRDMASNDPRVVGLRLYVEEENGPALEVYGTLGMDDSGYRVLEWMAPGPASLEDPP